VRMAEAIATRGGLAPAREPQGSDA
jgi:hypothetical protein